MKCRRSGGKGRGIFHYFNDSWESCYAFCFICCCFGFCCHVFHDSRVNYKHLSETIDSLLAKGERVAITLVNLGHIGTSDARLSNDDHKIYQSVNRAIRDLLVHYESNKQVYFIDVDYLAGKSIPAKNSDYDLFAKTFAVKKEQYYDQIAHIEDAVFDRGEAANNILTLEEYDAWVNGESDGKFEKLIEGQDIKNIVVVGHDLEYGVQVMVERTINTVAGQGRRVIVDKHVHGFIGDIEDPDDPGMLLYFSQEARWEKADRLWKKLADKYPGKFIDTDSVSYQSPCQFSSLAEGRE